MKLKSIGKLNDFLLLILLFFGLFDVARNYTKLPISFGYVKDIAIYLIFVLNFNRIFLPKHLGKGFYIWAFAVIAFSALGFLKSNYSNFSILVAYIKFLEIFLLILIFSNWNRIFNIRIKRFIHWYIVGSVLLCAVNIIGYCIDNPIVSVKLANANMPAGNYGGRITVGQPPLAVFPVVLSFIYLLIYSNTFRERILLGVFLFCIVISTSNTGILSIAVLLVLLFVYALFASNAKNIMYNILVLFLIGCAGLLLLYFIAPATVASLFERYANKIGQYFSSGSDPSMDIRQVHWQTGYNTMHDFDYIFGRGIYGYVDAENYPIENTFVITFLMYGIIGLIGLVAFFIRLLYQSFHHLHKKKSKSNLLLLSVCIVFLLHMYTLDLYFCYTLYFSLSLFIAYCNHEEKRVENKGLSVNNCNSYLQSQRFASADTKFSSSSDR